MRQPLEDALRYYRLIEAEIELLDAWETLGEQMRVALGVTKPDTALVFMLLERAEEAYARAGCPPLPIRDDVMRRWERLLPLQQRGN